MFDLSGRVALVTGASRGIGRAIVTRLAAQGATVVAAARGDHAREAAEELVRSGHRVEAVTLDVTDAEAEAMVAALLGSRTLPPRLLRFIQEKAGGNPLFIEEVTQALAERGLLVRENGGFTWTGNAEVAFPDTIAIWSVSSRMLRLDC